MDKTVTEYDEVDQIEAGLVDDRIEEEEDSEDSSDDIIEAARKLAEATVAEVNNTAVAVKSGSPEEVDALSKPDARGATPAESIARSIIPWPYDDDKSRYLGLRASGFTRREACKFLGIANNTVSWWKSAYPDFNKIEDNLPEYRKILAHEYVDIEYTRNFRLVLEKDFRVLVKSLKTMEELAVEDDMWSKTDNEYLLKIRGQYTPQMLKAISDLAQGVKDDKEFNFMDVIKDLAAKGEGRMAMEWKGSK